MAYYEIGKVKISYKIKLVKNTLGFRDYEMYLKFKLFQRYRKLVHSKIYGGLRYYVPDRYSSLEDAKDHYKQMLYGKKIAPPSYFREVDVDGRKCVLFIGL